MKKIIPLFLSLVLLVLTACGAPTDEEPENVRIFNFETMSSVEEREDGWVYYFQYVHPIDGEIIDVYYGYDAYNLKYKEIEGNMIPVIDGKTKEIIDYETPAVPALYYIQAYTSEIKKSTTFLWIKSLLSRFL